MEASWYSGMVDRFGRKLEKQLESDFPGDEELNAKVCNILTLLNYTILGAFVRTSVDKEKE